MKSSRALLLLALIGCKKDGANVPHGALASPGSPASTAEVDALWAKAPAGAVGGLVVSPRAITMIDHGWHDVLAFMRTFPQFAPAEAEAEASLAKVGLTMDFTLGDVGLAPGKGFAVFAVDKDQVLLIPVADRDKFVAKMKGKRGGETDQLADLTCKPVEGWYGCSTKLALLDTLGKGSLRGKLDPVKARGDVEGVVDVAPVKAAGVIQIERGQVVASGVEGGVPAEVAKMLGSPVRARSDLEHNSGFAVMNIEPMLREVPPFPIAEGMTAADLAHAVGGPLTVTMATGALAIDARIPLKDDAPFKKIIEHCADIPPLAMIGAKVDGGTCHVPVPQYNFAVDAWVEGKELRVGTKGASASGSAPVSAIGAEIAGGEWHLAFWGHGTLLAESPFKLPDLAGMPDEAVMAIKAMVMMNEVGIAVKLDGDSVRFITSFRSAWANPDDVVAKIMKVPAEDVLLGKAGAAGKAIADAAPNSPFAADFKGGTQGVMIPVAAIGVLAAVAVPAFLDYMKKSKQSEAAMQLNHIGKSLKRYYGENSAFPVGDAGPTPSFPTCCGLKSGGDVVDNKCPNSQSEWMKDKIWSALEFATDEPGMYRYTYHSDGKTVVVKAIGDADCDGAFATYTLNVAVDAAGNPSATLVKPEPGTY